jgi:SprT protein
MTVTETINTKQRQQVIELTQVYIKRARQIFNREFDFIPVSFNLTGRAAGMYKVSGDSGLIRYNPFIFARYFDQNIATTIPHEVAHYVTDKMYGKSRGFVFRSRRIKPHGQEWKEVMHAFGADASRTFNLNLEGLPVRKYRYFSYDCECDQHQLSSRRHNRVLRNQRKYYCQKCAGELRLSG